MTLTKIYMDEIIDHYFHKPAYIILQSEQKTRNNGHRESII